MEMKTQKMCTTNICMLDGNANILCVSTGYIKKENGERTGKTTDNGLCNFQRSVIIAIVVSKPFDCLKEKSSLKTL